MFPWSLGVWRSRTESENQSVTCELWISQLATMGPFSNNSNLGRMAPKEELPRVLEVRRFAAAREEEVWKIFNCAIAPFWHIPSVQELGKADLVFFCPADQGAISCFEVS